MANTEDKYSDLNLLEGVLARTRGTWEDFYQRFEPLIVACLRKAFHRHGVPCSPQDLEDLLGTVCLQLVRDDFKKLRQYDPEKGCKLSSWVGLISTNVAYDALRRRGPQVHSVDTGEITLDLATDDKPSPAEMTLKKERFQLLETAIKHLSPNDQLFLHYYYQNGMSPNDIAQELGISINTVYSRKNKVRTALRKIIEQLEKS